MLNIPGYVMLEQFRPNQDTVLYRAKSLATGHQVLLKVVNHGIPAKSNCMVRD